MMNSINEKNIDNLRWALLKAAGNNNKFFSDDIEDHISLHSIEKLAEIEVSKIESNTSFSLSIIGITAAFFGIGLSELFLGISLIALPESFSSYYIKGGLAICLFGLIFAVGANLLYNYQKKRIDFFHYIILKIDRQIASPKSSQGNLPEKEASRISECKVMDRLNEKLIEIKNGKSHENNKRLEEICVDEYSLNDAIEIAKHNTSILQPGAVLFMAMTAVFLNFFPNQFTRTVILIVGVALVWNLVKRVDKWNSIYLDLIELRRKKRGKWSESEGKGQ